MSALDGRIRHLAREEAAALLDSIKSPSVEMAAAGGTDRVAELEKQVADLTARLAKLENGTETASAEAPRTRRSPRKTAETSE
ncbi:hypothetical protein [Streptomyces caniscabiei]|uniref:Uncharacterized protein n=1 Tax=Streptomyces caniscabiei TaxID=2746961 RepID=A0ABU4MRT2_9ACTN|nr:hypothetical protein [Streptomyces caniscabiei]MBE4758293.1 hypothetical protein [Streptomyces caniscabiei]MBE4788385.1 hypothetical protein [Streptomyces caniscabiei]MBE4796098.1 hypothetical protein [Streptomyces caniscabiei]MDX2944403.1 hypothetical protein [Streptomyces caniscabiei]MDX2954632.1 hypothetical protein [Streptomyces caniscabiei]